MHNLPVLKEGDVPLCKLPIIRDKKWMVSNFMLKKCNMDVRCIEVIIALNKIPSDEILKNVNSKYPLTFKGKNDYYQQYLIDISFSLDQDQETCV